MIKNLTSETTLYNPHRTDKLIEQLLSLWECSVKATHHFLTPEDIDKLRPYVKIGLTSIQTLGVTYLSNIPVAFIGIDGNKVEMLFVSAGHFGKGIGKKLINYAIKKQNIEYVDVNEQNPEAVGFYKHLGFIIYDRTECDEQGNPFPILKMNRYKNSYNSKSI